MPTTPREMLRLAHAQAAFIRATGVPAGGSFVICSLGRDAIAIRLERESAAQPQRMFGLN